MWFDEGLVDKDENVRGKTTGPEVREGSNSRREFPLDETRMSRPGHALVEHQAKADKLGREVGRHAIHRDIARMNNYS